MHADPLQHQAIKVQPAQVHGQHADQSVATEIEHSQAGHAAQVVYLCLIQKNPLIDQRQIGELRQRTGDVLRQIEKHRGLGRQAGGRFTDQAQRSRIRETLQKRDEIGAIVRLPGQIHAGRCQVNCTRACSGLDRYVFQMQRGNAIEDEVRQMSRKVTQRDLLQAQRLKRPSCLGEIVEAPVVPDRVVDARATVDISLTHRGHCHGFVGPGVKTGAQQHLLAQQVVEPCINGSVVPAGVAQTAEDVFGKRVFQFKHANLVQQALIGHVPVDLAVAAQWVTKATVGQAHGRSAARLDRLHIQQWREVPAGQGIVLDQRGQRLPLAGVGKAQLVAFGIGQGVQHGRVKIVQPVQVLVVSVTGLVTIAVLDQHFAHRRILGTDAVDQPATEIPVMDLQPDL